jgi:hypothetical protein
VSVRSGLAELRRRRHEAEVMEAEEARSGPVTAIDSGVVRLQ